MDETLGALRQDNYGLGRGELGLTAGH
jgi:hypothetical protein